MGKVIGERREGMQKICLNGEWKLKVLGKNGYGIGTEEMPAKVPGSVYGTLMEQKKIPDLYYRDYVLQANRFWENDFEYSRSFTIEEKEAESDVLLLCFDGIDTLADIYVNEMFVGVAYNMHRKWEFDIADFVGAGENRLRVVLHSTEVHSQLRKASCMFGWNGGPALPDAGIFRNVEIIAADTARIEQVYISQVHEPGKVTLDFETTVELFGEKDTTTIEAKVYSPEGEVFEQNENEQIEIKHPKLWWPNGYGAQPLYTMEVVLKNETGEQIDCWKKRIGLRTVTMNTEKDNWGNCFAHEINGVKIFAMGADYVPEDNILARVTKERTRKLLEDCVAANYNMIRVWAGGCYPDDYFYDICDELGLLVWQDFMFANMGFHLEDEFEENVRQEITDNVRRIRHHACLGLWCGNRNLEAGLSEKKGEGPEKQKYDYIKLFEYIIPRILKEEDPGTFYWPSSPSSGGNFENTWDEDTGDSHYWEVGHGDKSFTEYRRFRFRYLSEFGFPSFPCLKTIEMYTLPEERNLFSRTMEIHQTNREANGILLKHLSDTYLYPKDFDHLLYAFQLLQADAVRNGIEHFRRHRGRCMGTVVRQLNDIWPGASESGIDYYGRWKALHYAEKRAFAPIMISCEELGETDVQKYPVTEEQDFEKSIRIHVANETMQEISGEVRIFLRDTESVVLWQERHNIRVPALSGFWFGKEEFPECDIYNQYASYEFWQKGKIVSEGSCLFTAPKYFRFKDPKLSYRVEGEYIIIHAENYAKSVEIQGVDADVRFEDNFFDMNEGEKKIRIVEGNATAYKLRSVYDIANTF